MKRKREEPYLQMIRWRKRVAAFIPMLMLAALMLTAAGSLIVVPSQAKAETTADIGTAVYVVPVKQTVESGLKAFLERAYKEAEEAKAERVILVINTFGGKVTSAEEIGELIRKSSVPTTAYVESKAVSAGTYIALNADSIIMEPHSMIGSASVVNGSGDLIQNPKIISHWVSAMSEAAKMNGRNPDVAAAMVDPDIVLKLPEIGRDKAKGQILSLSADEAVKLGYAEHQAGSVQEAIKLLGLDNRRVVDFEPSLAEKVSRFLVNPYVMTALLVLGIAGVALEMIIPGFGAPGIVGILSFALYFFGHYIAGFAGMESVVLCVVGFAFLVIEVFIPSFGILGILGSIALVAGVVTASPDPMNAFISLVVALVLAVIILYFVIRKYKTKGIWNKFILREKLTTEQGYVSADSKTNWLGQEGVAVTPLRPSGTAQIGDQRIDVVTAGEFIASGKPVKVVKAEGTWVVVKEI